MRRVALVLAVLGVGLAALFGAATPASAHAVLRSTTPAQNASVATLPAEVTLTFDEPPFAVGSVVEVAGPSGTLVSSGPVRIVDETVHQALSGDGPAGRYTVRWRVTSNDGHPVSGTFGFTVTSGSASASPITSSTTPAAVDARPAGSGGVPVWVWVVIGIGLLVVASAVGWALRRTSGG